MPLSVHRDVLVAASPGLAEMCNGSAEPDDGIIFLFDQCPETIRALCYWMYHDEICIPYGISQISSTHPEALETAPGLFVKLYIAGFKFSMPRLRNDAIDALLSRARTIDLVKLSSYVYANTEPGSQLGKLLVRVVNYKWSAEELNEQRGLVCEEFLWDLAMAAFKDRDQGFNRWRDRVPPQEGFCREFHEHRRGEGRCGMMKGFVVADEGCP